MHRIAKWMLTCELVATLDYPGLLVVVVQWGRGVEEDAVASRGLMVCVGIEVHVVHVASGGMPVSVVVLAQMVHVVHVVLGVPGVRLAIKERSGPGALQGLQGRRAKLVYQAAMVLLVSVVPLLEARLEMQADRASTARVALVVSGVLQGAGAGVVLLVW